MERLLAGYKPLPNDGTVVGVPVDSEYIIFVIDTSTSMTHNAWQAVQRVMDETLRVYPSVQGLQVLNDEGRYLFPAFARQWIPDSPQIRSLILQRMRVWRAFSDSNPAEGIAEAINSFHDGSRKMSIHVYGDDFPPLSAEALVRYVEHINRPDRFGKPAGPRSRRGVSGSPGGRWVRSGQPFRQHDAGAVRTQRRNLRCAKQTRLTVNKRAPCRKAGVPAQRFNCFPVA